MDWIDVAGMVLLVANLVDWILLRGEFLSLGRSIWLRALTIGAMILAFAVASLSTLEVLPTGTLHPFLATSVSLNCLVSIFERHAAKSRTGVRH